MKKLLLSILLVSTAMLGKAEVTIGGKNFTEQLLLAELTNQLLENRGIAHEKKDGMGTTVLRKALENGQIDVYWEYTGTALRNFHKIKDAMSADEVYNKIKELDKPNGITWLNASQANNTYALAMRSDDAKAKGIATISDLGAKINGGEALKFGSNAEFYSRADGFKPLQKLYGFKVPRSDVKRMDTGLVYKALKDGQVDFGVVFATDGRIPAFNFVVLKDDKNYFPAYYVAPVARQAALDENTGLAEALNDLSAVLNDDSLSALNATVDVDKVSVEAAAKKFLSDNGLLK